MKQRVCKRCGRPGPLDAFHAQATSAGGYRRRRVCKECVNRERRERSARERRCITCRTVKPIGEFHRSSRDGRQWECKECARQRQRLRYARDKERVGKWGPLPRHAVLRKREIERRKAVIRAEREARLQPPADEPPADKSPDGLYNTEYSRPCGRLGTMFYRVHLGGGR